MVNQYFDKRLGRANGFAYGGVGVGIMIASPIMTLLIEEYTWRGAQLIMACFFANCCVVATIFRPLSWWSQNRIDRTPESIPLDTNLDSVSRERREEEMNRTGLIDEQDKEDTKFEGPLPDMPDDTDSIRREFLHKKPFQNNSSKEAVSTSIENLTNVYVIVQSNVVCLKSWSTYLVFHFCGPTQTSSFSASWHFSTAAAISRRTYILRVTPKQLVPAN